MIAAAFKAVPYAGPDDDNHLLTMTVTLVVPRAKAEVMTQRYIRAEELSAALVWISDQLVDATRYPPGPHHDN